MKVLGRLVSVLVLALVAGCSGNVFYVDSRFSAEEERKMQTAAESWMAAGAPFVDFVWRQHVSENETGRNVIVKVGQRVADASDPYFASGYACAVTQHRVSNTRILVGDWVLAQNFRSVLAHEFGHYYGLKHSDDPEAVMYPPPGSESPTQNDVDALQGVLR